MTASLNPTRFWYPDHQFFCPPPLNLITIEQTTFWSISWRTNSYQSSSTSKYRPNFLSAPLAIYSCVSATSLGCQQPWAWRLCFWGRRCQCSPLPTRFWSNLRTEGSSCRMTSELYNVSNSLVFYGKIRFRAPCLETGSIPSIFTFIQSDSYWATMWPIRAHFQDWQTWIGLEEECSYSSTYQAQI